MAPDTTDARMELARIELARIDERLHTIIENQERDRAFNAQRFDVLEQKTDDLARQLAQANQRSASCMATQEERWKHHDQDHDQLNARKNQGDLAAASIGTAAGVIAIVLNAFGIGKP